MQGEYSGSMRELGEHAAEIIRALEGEPAALHERRAEIASVLQHLVDTIVREAAAREACAEQLAAQRDLIRVIACPILQVRPDAVCVPLMGPVDADRTAHLTGDLLAEVVRRRTRLVVIDVSGALITDLSAVGYLSELIQALRLLGAHGVLSGIGPETADMMVSAPDCLVGVATYRTLEDALSHPP